MKSPRKAASGNPIDAYLASIPKDQRVVLEKVRRTIRSVAPKATEVISYGIPTFNDGRMLVAFAAFKNHFSFFPLGSSVLDAYEDELKPYRVTKGTLRFTADQPIPAALLKKIVKARTKQNRERAAAAKRKKHARVPHETKS